MPHSPPFTGIRVLEFAGLAPGPFTGLLLADYGATVIRLDRAAPGTHSDNPPAPGSDLLHRHKTSICVDIKTAGGVALVKSLIPTVDVVIDPFRPGVLEKAGLSPEKVLQRLNPRLIVGRMTGFRRDGKYKDMAGHDINYIAVSGVLSMLGRKHEKPYPPLNILGDFAGGGLVCFLGIVMALYDRERTGLGQVVEANMVDGAAYLGTFPRLGLKTKMWARERGDNLLDTGSPFYDTYETKDGKYMSVGALEPQFFAALLKGLDIDPSAFGGPRDDRATWPKMKQLFTDKFLSKNRTEWEAIFDGTDACCLPVLTQAELEQANYDQRPVVTLKESPGLGIAEKDPDERSPAEGQGLGVQGEGWSATGLSAGMGGEEMLGRWMGWIKGRHYDVQDGALVRLDRGSKL